MLSLTYDELLRYTAEEREKWRRWLLERPDALEIPVQPEARFSTVGRLIDHIFLVERRHLQRLRAEPVAESTGLTGHNAAPLFDYGASVRRELEQFVQGLDEDEADRVRAFTTMSGTEEMTGRKLLFHILLHEIRHWAQIALAVRLSGHEPPGRHDLFFSRALR